MTLVNVNAILTCRMDFAGNKQGFGLASENAPRSSHSIGAIEWEASEYIHHDKGAVWLVFLALIALTGIGAAIWFRQWMFAFLLGVMAIAFGYYAVRKPRVIRYKLSDKGLMIDKAEYSLSTFRGFGVIADGAFYAISLISSKRFSPAIMIYFAKEDGEKIVDILGAHIPMEQMQPDLIDTLMRKLRF